jgi:hypothetical protein
MSAASEDPFVHLQREYLGELPAIFEEMRQGVADFRAGRDGAAAGLRLQFHRLAGSGGSRLSGDQRRGAEAELG